MNESKNTGKAHIDGSCIHEWMQWRMLQEWWEFTSKRYWTISHTI